MTLAIGALCPQGVIIAVDQAITKDGVRTYGTKISGGATKHFSFALAYSSNNATAAKDLLEEITSNLKASDLSTLEDIKDLIRRDMNYWHLHYGQNEVPYTQFVCGVSVSDNESKESDHALFLCEPPATVSRETFNSDSRGFIAIGASQLVSPLRRLFEDVMPLKSRLVEVTYLMKRAKAESIYVDGRTDVIVVRAGNPGPPLEVRYWDVRFAEGMSEELENIFRMTTSALLYPDEASRKYLSEQVQKRIFEYGKELGEHNFQAVTGEDI